MFGSAKVKYLWRVLLHSLKRVASERFTCLWTDYALFFSCKLWLSKVLWIRKPYIDPWIDPPFASAAINKGLAARTFWKTPSTFSLSHRMLLVVMLVIGLTGRRWSCAPKPWKHPETVKGCKRMKGVNVYRLLGWYQTHSDESLLRVQDLSIAILINRISQTRTHLTAKAVWTKPLTHRHRNALRSAPSDEQAFILSNITFGVRR